MAGRTWQVDGGEETERDWGIPPMYMSGYHVNVVIWGRGSFGKVNITTVKDERGMGECFPP